MKDYYKELIKYLQKIDDESDRIDQIASIVSKTLINGGIIYFFGCGHSNIIGEDNFFRAGGLVNVQPIFEEKLMLHESASRSSMMEKKEENAKGILDRYEFTKNDVLFVVSTSGKNGVPVDIALQAKEKGLFTIGISSSEYLQEKSKHSSGKLLKEVVDEWIDNCVPKGDAVIDFEDDTVKAGAVSTPLTTCLVQMIITRAEQMAVSKGATLDIFKSGNVDGGVEYNNRLVDKYKDKIKSL